MPPTAPSVAFEAPWHAQLFALTVHLSEQGAFSWPDWTQALGASLSAAGASACLDGGDDYYLAWLDALEHICAARGLAEAALLSDLRHAWEDAYLSTPHGAPVRLGPTPSWTLSGT